MPKHTKAPLAPSAASAFKKRSGGLLTLPSGETVKVKNPGGIRAFISAGMIPNSLMSLVESSLAGKPIDIKDALAPDGEINTDMVTDMMALNDRITMACVVEPKVYPVPEDEEDRQDDRLYVDELEDDDKMFIFQWATGGTKDISQFRRELSSAMDSLASE